MKNRYSFSPSIHIDKKISERETTGSFRMKTNFRILAFLVSGAVFLSANDLVSQENDQLTRSSAEEQLFELDVAYRAAPGDDENRRAYAKMLYALGNVCLLYTSPSPRDRG